MDSTSSYVNKKWFKAGMNFASGNYQSAIEGYTELIKESPSSSNYYLYRSLCYIKIKEYQKAFEDIKEEEKISKPSFVLLLNKGIALFHIGNFLEAKTSFNSSLTFAIETEQKNKISVWINKANLEMKEKGIIESTNTGELKVIYNWIQTPKTVSVEIKSNHELNEYEVQIHSKSIILLDKKDGSIKYELKLTNSIKPSNSQFKINGKRIDFELEKEVFEFNWVNLEFLQPVESGSVLGGYPSSAKSKKDWDKMVSEIDQEIKKDSSADSNEGMMKLFKDIYERSDEKTRRAMIKSFQTSGGTVLSTNWDEVKDKDYEGKDRPEAPKGQEWAGK